jgi:hypothetical protein
VTAWGRLPGASGEYPRGRRWRAPRHGARRVRRGCGRQDHDSSPWPAWTSSSPPAAAHHRPRQKTKSHYRHLRRLQSADESRGDKRATQDCRPHCPPRRRLHGACISAGATRASCRRERRSRPRVLCSIPPFVTADDARTLQVSRSAGGRVSFAAAGPLSRTTGSAERAGSPIWRAARPGPRAARTGTPRRGWEGRCHARPFTP